MSVHFHPIHMANAIVADDLVMPGALADILVITPLSVPCHETRANKYIKMVMLWEVNVHEVFSSQILSFNDLHFEQKAVELDTRPYITQPVITDILA